MEGINYVIDDNNRKIGVLIDLRKYGELWEDFYDVLVAESRKDDEKISLDDLIDTSKKQGKLP